MNFQTSFNQSKIICFNELKQSFKNWKIIVALVIYLVIMFASLNLVDDLQETLGNVDFPGKRDNIDVYDNIRENFGSLSIIVPFSLALIILPFIVLFMNFDSISNERNSNRFRYLLMKTDLHNLLLGKFFTSIIILSISTIFFFLITDVHLHFYLGESFNFSSLFYPWLFLIFYGASLSAFFILTSSFFKSSFGALAGGLLGMFALMIFSSIPVVGYFGLFSYLKFAVYSSFGKALLSVVMFFVLSILYLFLAYLKIRRSDL